MSIQASCCRDDTKNERKRVADNERAKPAKISAGSRAHGRARRTARLLTDDAAVPGSACRRPARPWRLHELDREIGKLQVGSNTYSISTFLSCIANEELHTLNTTHITNI
jgi:hypothetical protein